jgi:membrane protein DedA with SNARE-associated domain
VENLLFTLVGSQTGVFAYLIVLAILLACGLGVPLPEDVSLILGGILVYEGHASLWLMIVTGYVGIIGGDTLMFYLGRRIGTKVGQKQGGFFSRIVTPEKRARVEGLFKKHGEKIIMLARFLPGVRSVTYFTAGSVHMKYSHFVFFDSVAALASAPIFVLLGYKFGDKFEYLVEQIRKGQRGVLIALAVIVAVTIIFSRWRARREAKANAEALAAQLETSVPGPGESASPQSTRVG